MLQLFQSKKSKQMSEQLSKLAVGNFTLNCSPIEGEMNSPQATLRNMIRSLKSLLRFVDRSSQQLDSKVIHMYQKSEIISVQVENVTSTIREISGGVQDASEYIQNIAEEIAQIHNFVMDVENKQRECRPCSREVQLRGPYRKARNDPGDGTNGSYPKRKYANTQRNESTESCSR